MVIDDRLGEISHAENLYSVCVQAKLYVKLAVVHPVRLYDLFSLNDDIDYGGAVSAWTHEIMILLLNLCIFCKYILIVHVLSVCLIDICVASLLTISCLFFSESYCQIIKCRYVANLVFIDNIIFI